MRMSRNGSWLTSRRISAAAARLSRKDGRPGRCGKSSSARSRGSSNGSNNARLKPSRYVAHGAALAAFILMARTTSDVLVDRLIDWGVTVVFGLPGDGINGFMEALRTRQDRVSFVQVRHEEAAAFMACGYAKYTGKLGVCLATSGPGAIHLLNGLYDAKMDGAPVLALTGQTYHDLIGTRYQQEVDLLSLFKDVAVYNQQVLGAGHVRALIDAGCRAALSVGGVAHITCPVDLQEQDVGEDEPSRKKVEGHTSSAWRPPVVVPCDADIQAAADVLNAGTKTVILAG